jgi:hypothetical protein
MALVRDQLEKVVLQNQGGSKSIKRAAEAAGAPLLAQIPIDPELARLCDEGDIERYDSEGLDNFAEAFLRAVSPEAE